MAQVFWGILLIFNVNKKTITYYKTNYDQFRFLHYSSILLTLNKIVNEQNIQFHLRGSNKRTSNYKKMIQPAKPRAP